MLCGNGLVGQPAGAHHTPSTSELCSGIYSKYPVHSDLLSGNKPFFNGIEISMGRP